MGGGKTTTTTEIPAFLREAMQESIARGKQAASIGYTPYFGPDVAALTPMQEAAMANTNAGASAFGLAAPTGTSMPEAQTFAGGVRGYSSAPMFEAALAELKARNPAQYAALLAPFINPQTGAVPVAQFAPPPSPLPQPTVNTGGGSSSGGGAMNVPPRSYTRGTGAGSFGLPDPMSGRFAGTNFSGPGGRVVNAVTRALSGPSNRTVGGGR